jgi:hypothetical protein
VTAEREPDRPARPRVAAVFPCAFRWDAPALQSYQKAMDLVLALAARERVIVCGPDEFQVVRPGDPDPTVATDLVRILAVSGLETCGFLAFRGWAERRVATGVAVVEGRGRTAAAASEDVTYVAHLEVWDAATGGAILELSASADALPAGLRPEYDPAPELTALNRRLAEEAWERLEPRLAAPPLREVPLTARWLPAAALDWAPRGRPSLRERMREMDPVLADLERVNLYRYFDPEATPHALHDRMRLPGGLLVESARGEAEGLLLPGDVVTAVNGQPVVGPQVLQRAAQLRPGRLELRVARGASRLDVPVSPR